MSVPSAMCACVPVHRRRPAPRIAGARAACHLLILPTGSKNTNHLFKKGLDGPECCYSCELVLLVSGGAALGMCMPFMDVAALGYCYSEIAALRCLSGAVALSKLLLLVSGSAAPGMCVPFMDVAALDYCYSEIAALRFCYLNIAPGKPHTSFLRIAPSSRFIRF
eukprot:scaffold24552_cov21-Tisochrysis_lutea.AAC.3